MKVVLFVDGSNLFGGLTELLKPGEYIDFNDLLSVIKKDFLIDEVRFYGTYMQINPEKSKAYALMVASQKAFFDSAKANKKIKFFKGRFSGAGKEKGVDVRIAVDMTVGAAKNEFDVAIIMTGDADLVYAVETTRQLDKQVFLTALGSRYPFGMVVHVDKTFVYDYQGFFKTRVLPNYTYKPKNLVLKELDGKIKILHK